jgi:hypothetical protein
MSHALWRLLVDTSKAVSPNGRWPVEPVAAVAQGGLHTVRFIHSAEHSRLPVGFYFAFFFLVAD